MQTTEQKGQIAMLKVQQRAVEIGMTVSIPTVPARYDCVIDNGGKLSRAQVKYANGKSSHSDGSVFLRLEKWRKNRRPVYTGDEIDLLLIYSPVLDKIVALPKEIFDGKTSLTIRLIPPKNGQKSVRLATEFVW